MSGAIPPLSQYVFMAWCRTLMFLDRTNTRIVASNPIQRIEVRGCIQKFPDWIDNEINNNNNKHSLRSNTKGYGCKTHKTDSQNRDTTARSGRELYHLQFSLQVAGSKTFGYTFIYCLLFVWCFPMYVETLQSAYLPSRVLQNCLTEFTISEVNSISG
jgi:hypothetical protein